MGPASKTRHLSLGFVVVILLTGLITLLSLDRVTREEATLSRIVEDLNARLLLGQQMLTASRDRLLVLHAIALETDPFVQDEQWLELQRLGEKFLEARVELVALGLDKQEMWLLEQHRQTAIEVMNRQSEVVDLSMQADQARALDDLLHHVIPGQTKALSHISELIRYEQQRSETAFHNAQARLRRDFYYMLVLGLVALFAGGLVAWFTIRYVRRLLNHQEELNRNLEARVEERTYELSVLNKSLTEEISLRQEAQNRLERLANFDHLTGLPNRVMFQDTLDAEISRSKRYERSMALLFLDLDGFKAVNDNYGHDVGDELLKQAAGRIREALRAEDMVARLGGDEFTVILPDVKQTGQVKFVAAKIIEVLAEPFHVMDATLDIGSSIGIALYPKDGEDRETLVNNADQAMYQVKYSGKNDFRFYAPNNNVTLLGSHRSQKG